jgi:hypothetical protein
MVENSPDLVTLVAYNCNEGYAPQPHAALFCFFATNCLPTKQWLKMNHALT